jgi:hypothetical protein
MNRWHIEIVGKDERDLENDYWITNQTFQCEQHAREEACLMLLEGITCRVVDNSPEGRKQRLEKLRKEMKR